MTHHELWLLAEALWTALILAAGWEWGRSGKREAVEDAEDRGWDEALAEIERERVTAVLIEEAAGDMAGPTLLTDTQQLPGQQTMTDEEYEVYAQSHVISQELAAYVAAANRPREHPDSDFSNHCCTHPGTGICMCDCHDGRICQTEPRELGDDTLTELYARHGTWEQDQRAIAATGQTRWFLDWQQRQAVA